MRMLAGIVQPTSKPSTDNKACQDCHNCKGNCMQSPTDGYSKAILHRKTMRHRKAALFSTQSIVQCSLAQHESHKAIACCEMDRFSQTLLKSKSAQMANTRATQSMAKGENRVAPLAPASEREQIQRHKTVWHISSSDAPWYL